MQENQADALTHGMRWRLISKHAQLGGGAPASAAHSIGVLSVRYHVNNIISAALCFEVHIDRY